MTIIDIDLAVSLRLPLEKTEPILVVGIGSRYISSTYIKLDVYFRGYNNTAKISIEVYLVGELRAKLLISIDVLAPEGFRLDFEKSIARIASYIGLTIPIAIYAKEYY